MQTIACSCCNNISVPKSTSMKIDGEVYCANCLELNFPYEENVKDKTIEKLIDKTVCSFCNKDNGSIELNTIGNSPVCEDCETRIKNLTFPNWVKGFFALIVLIVVFAFFWNWKYYDAYNDFKAANISIKEGNYSNASILMRNASEKVPEVAELKTLSTYYNGLNFLTKDKSEEALVEFNKCKQDLPDDYNINDLILQATMGATFDKKDYEGFLSASKESLKLDSLTALSWARLASAYACIYASNGDDSSKTLANNSLTHAKSIDSISKEMNDYYKKIEYRIYSRQILSTEDYNKKYPNGWSIN